MKRWSLFIGSYAGIKVFIHWTFWIIIGWIFLMHFQMGHGRSEGLAGVVFILVLFACVVLHEFGHALTAKRYGIPTQDITLYPIGGVASLNKIPDKPGQELAVALAGPAVNLAIAGVLYAALAFSGKLAPLSETNLIGMNNFWFNLMIANIILALFNLIPAFPMDGGRVLRALLAFRMDKLQATNIAAKVGQFLAILFVFFGFFTNFWLVFIGLFIFLGASGEAAYEQQKAVLKGVKVKDVMLKNVPSLPAHLSIGAALHSATSTQDSIFLVTEQGLQKGLLTLQDLIDGLQETEIEAPLSQIMRTDFEAIHEDMPLSDALEKAFHSGIEAAPVVDRGQVVGVLSKKHIQEKLELNKQLKKLRI